MAGMATKGFMESADGVARTRLIIGDQDLDLIPLWDPIDGYFDLYLKSLLGQEEMPLSWQRSCTALESL